MGIVKTFDPKFCIVTFGVPIGGWADGQFINVVPASQRFNKVVGADGEVARNKSNDLTSEVTLTVLLTSPSNTYLTTILELDRIANIGILPLQIFDLLNGTLFFWNQAWIRQPPDVVYSKEIEARAWTFDTGQVVQEIIGGNLV